MYCLAAWCPGLWYPRTLPSARCPGVCTAWLPGVLVYCLVARCPDVLINGFRGEPEEAVASGWSYLGPHCTRLCHLHHLQHAATCADCFLISFPSNSKQLFDRPCHCVIQGEVGTWEEYGLTDISIFEELSFRFYAFW